VARDEGIELDVRGKEDSYRMYMYGTIVLDRTVHPLPPYITKVRYRARFDAQPPGSAYAKNPPKGLNYVPRIYVRETVGTTEREALSSTQ
jgi:hypothetical protein